ncbi:PREDICTED: uncharacterized protein LOC106817612 [Priapulus caudatus]|uniref:Uncharacterized protein LOC106817612 n=1 Tax=Priapulus caudatus TaxID=37621 RepID=A0ABM1F006_PRICU|nr:PREDICTED: uncharacterized protein LOC106817612 [Priapulus caudatus]
MKTGEAPPSSKMGRSNSQTSSEKKSSTPLSASSNSLFAEEPEADMFATVPPPLTRDRKSKVKPGGMALFDNSDEEEPALFSIAGEKIGKPVKSSPIVDTQNLSKPLEKKKTLSLFDSDTDDDDDETFRKTMPSTSHTTTVMQVQSAARVPHVAPAKKPISLFDDGEVEALDDTGAFSSPTSVLVDKTEPLSAVTEPKPEGKKRSKSLFEDEDLLFGSQQDSPDVDLFGAQSPLTTPTVELAKPSFMKQTSREAESNIHNAVTREKVESNMKKTSTAPPVPPKTKMAANLFSNDDGQDLFSVAPIEHVRKPPKVASKTFAMQLPVEEEMQDAEVNQPPGNISSSRSSSEEPSSSSSFSGSPIRKKPVGGVALFEGLDPFAGMKRRKQSDNEEGKIQDSVRIVW